jgi:Sec-independent protein translocase protein TatA
MLNFVKNLSPTEIGAIALILIVLFGAKVVTKMGKLGGETLKEINKIKRSFTEDVGNDSRNDKKEVSK